MVITRTKTRTPVHRVPQTLFSNACLGDEFSRRRYLAQLAASGGNLYLPSSQVDPSSGSGENRQASCPAWQTWATVEHCLAGTCIRSWMGQFWAGGRHRVEGWYFRLARKDRRSRLALEATENPCRWKGWDLPEYRLEVFVVVLCRRTAMTGLFLLVSPGVRCKKTAKEGTYLRQSGDKQIMAFACFVCFGHQSLLRASPSADMVIPITKTRKMGTELDSDGDPWGASDRDGISATRPNNGPNGLGGRA